MIIGNSVAKIGIYAFKDCDNISSIYIAAVNPPSIENLAFDIPGYAVINLYVPTKVLSAYKNHSVWGQFYFISTYDATGIESIEVIDSTDAPIYNLQGIKMQNADNLPAGIYIKNGKKYIIK